MHELSGHSNGFPASPNDRLDELVVGVGVAIVRQFGQRAHDVASPVPLHLRNAPTKLMKELEYGKGYRYAHDDPDAVTEMSCLPANLKDRQYYVPADRGLEKQIGERLKEIRANRKK